MNLARSVLRQKLGGAMQEIAQPDDSQLKQPAGSFVSLHEIATHRLRGCVGRLDAVVPLWECVRHTAAAVLTDPRFVNDPVTLPELQRLTLEISVISPLRVCAAMEFDLLNDGIYVMFRERAGCFLPQVARETGWAREQLLARLCTEKLGLPAETWRHPEAKLFAFGVELIGPEAF
jgi:AmmeMemoRadiSam system protein A